MNHAGDDEDTNADDLPKWRPIQCTVSLTGSEEKNHGGFECVKGFHKEFDHYFKGTKSEQFTSGDRIGSLSRPLAPTICVGQFTRLRPHEDKTVVNRYTHIPAKPGRFVKTVMKDVYSSDLIFLLD